MTGRAWWRELLGAARDPGGGWTVGEARPWPAHPGWCQQEVRLRSYGAALPAVAVRPVAPARPLPAVVVPFYDVAGVLGEAGTAGGHLGGRGYAAALARCGLAVLAVPWWFEQQAAGDPATAGADALAARYGPAAGVHAARWTTTGLGRAVADLVLAVDALAAQPWVDPARIGVLGHSLGAKLALHLAALDQRLRAAVAHEPGLGFAHSNWADPWYLGDRVPPGRDQDELLALVAPRAFLLAGGGASDGAHNRHLVERARPAWADTGGLDTLYHDGGHPLPDRILAAMAGWLAAELCGPTGEPQ